MVQLPQELLSHIFSYLVLTPQSNGTWENNYEASGFHISADETLKLETMRNISQASSSLHQAVEPYLLYLTAGK